MDPRPDQHAPSSPLDEAEIRALYQQLLDGWNKRNAVEMASPFAEDGEMIGFDGSQVTGRAEIVNHLQPIFASHPTPAYVSKVRSIRFLGSQAAILHAISGLVPDGKSELVPALNAHHTLVANKFASKWYIVLFQNTPAQFHGRPELVEEWTNELRQLLP